MINIKHFLLFLFCIVETSHLLAQATLSPHSPYALVELYTSQGCGSCPAVEQILNDFDTDSTIEKEGIVFVSFHVDYWNDKGWLDPFSKSLYSERQKRYASFLNQEGVYTPQFVINGTSGFSGSNGPRLKRELKLLPKITKMNIELSQIKYVGDKIQFHYLRSDTLNCVFNIALISDSDTTLVTQGENAGRTMISKNTVRSFVNFANNKKQGNAFILAPNSISTSRLKLVVWLQDIHTAALLALEIYPLP
jgi:hypothetical protein